MPRCCRIECRSVAWKAPLPGLSMTGSPGSGIELGDDVVAGLAAHQDAPHRARRRRCEVLLRPRTFLAGGRSERSGRWPSRVCIDQQAGGAPGRQQPAVRLDRAAQLRDVVAQHLAKAAGLEEVALHVDDQQGAFGRPQFERIGLGRDGRRLRLHSNSPRRGTSGGTGVAMARSHKTAPTIFDAIAAPTRAEVERRGKKLAPRRQRAEMRRTN